MLRTMTGRTVHNVLEAASHIIQIGPGDGDYKMFTADRLSWVTVRAVDQ